MVRSVITGRAFSLRLESCYCVSKKCFLILFQGFSLVFHFIYAEGRPTYANWHQHTKCPWAFD